MEPRIVRCDIDNVELYNFDAGELENTTRVLVFSQTSNLYFDFQQICYLWFVFFLGLISC